jgi:Sec-independent protein translocase protein TatA
MIKNRNTGLIFALLFGIASLTMSCRSSEKMPKEVRTAQKAEIKEEKELEKEYKQLVKRHLRSQSNNTRKSMRELKREHRRLNRTKKRSLWDRIFKNKCDNKPLDSDI